MREASFKNAISLQLSRNGDIRVLIPAELVELVEAQGHRERIGPGRDHLHTVVTRNIDCLPDARQWKPAVKDRHLGVAINIRSAQARQDTGPNGTKISGIWDVSCEAWKAEKRLAGVRQPPDHVSKK